MTRKNQELLATFIWAALAIWTLCLVCELDFRHRVDTCRASRPLLESGVCDSLARAGH